MIGLLQNIFHKHDFIREICRNCLAKKNTLKFEKASINKGFDRFSTNFQKQPSSHNVYYVICKERRRMVSFMVVELQPVFESF